MICYTGPIHAASERADYGRAEWSSASPLEHSGGPEGRVIFEWRAEGRSLRRMANDLNDKGVPTQQQGRKWYPSVVWHLYLNRFYTGRSKSGGKWVKGEHEAIVSDDLFKRANARNRRAG